MRKEYELIDRETLDYNFFKISGMTSIYNQDPKGLCRLGGVGDKAGAYGLDSYEDHFIVEVENKKGETKQFTIVFCLEERNDGMRNYKGDEVCISNVECDESEELKEFLDYSQKAENILNDLNTIASVKAEIELSFLLSENENK